MTGLSSCGSRYQAAIFEPDSGLNYVTLPLRYGQSFSVAETLSLAKPGYVVIFQRAILDHSLPRYLHLKHAVVSRSPHIPYIFDWWPPSTNGRPSGRVRTSRVPSFRLRYGEGVDVVFNLRASRPGTYLVHPMTVFAVARQIHGGARRYVKFDGTFWSLGCVGVKPSVCESARRRDSPFR